MNNPNDTILAVSTPWGNSPRSIIRVSGKDALPCTLKVFKEAQPSTPVNTIDTYRALRGHVELGDNITAPACLYIMKAPRSYTREDVVEIHTIGSPPVVETLLEKILKAASTAGMSLRLAEPGEFTKRAFLNGRIDILQAEAVLRVIRSRTDAELRLATSQLRGEQSQGLKTAHERIINLLSLIELSIDFSDQDIQPVPEKDILEGLETIIKDLRSYTHRFDRGRAYSSGIRATLIGPPNAGKSSLFNALLGRPRAITHHKSGTTRDYLAAELVVNGTAFQLIDTAGLIDTSLSYNGVNTLETLATNMTSRAMDVSLLFILILDGSRPVEEVFNLLSSLCQSLNDSNCILVVNKTDLPQKFFAEDLPPRWQGLTKIYTSATMGGGIEELKAAMVEKITSGDIDCSASPALLNTRQKILLEACLGYLEEAAQSLRAGTSAEFTALELREASDALGELLGKITTEDILEKIFSQFCIGK